MHMWMATLSVFLGAAAAWLVLLSASAGVGLGGAWAWSRWGDRVPIPPALRERVSRVVTKAVALVPPKWRPTPSEAKPGAPLAPVGTLDLRDSEPPGQIVGPVPGATAGAAAARDTSLHSEQQEGDASAEAIDDLEDADSSATFTHDDADALDNQGPDGSPNGRIPELPEPGEPESPTIVQAPVRRPRIDRAEAIEELTSIFELPYETAVSLLEAGLWGLENHDEWARAARSGQAPAGIEPEVLQAVLSRGGDELVAARKAFHAKRDALNALEALPGVSAEDARKLFEAGYTDTEALCQASTDKLAKIEGVTRARAFQIRAAAHGLAPTP